MRSLRSLVFFAVLGFGGCQLANPANSNGYEPSRLPVGELTLAAWLPAGLDQYRFQATDRQQLADLGINQIEWLQRENIGETTAEEVAMAFASDNGIRMPVYYEAPGFSPYDKLHNWAIRTEVEAEVFEMAVRERVIGLRDHWAAAAGFNGYLIGHEDYRARFYEPLGRLVRVLKQEDQWRPAVVVGNIDSYPKSGRFLKALFVEGGAPNIFQHEHYIFRGDLPTSGARLQKSLDHLVSGYGRVARHLQGRHGRWHAIVQVQSEIRVGKSGSGVYYRKPTAGEIRVQVGLALARGASGIVYFLYSSGIDEVRSSEGNLIEERLSDGLVDREGVPTDSYSAVKELNRQLTEMSENLRNLHFHGGYDVDNLPDNEELFSGVIWSGEESIELGLVDGLASASEVARDIIGTEYIINYTKRENYFDRFAKQIGTAFFNSFGTAYRAQ